MILMKIYTVVCKSAFSSGFVYSKSTEKKGILKKSLIEDGNSTGKNAAGVVLTRSLYWRLVAFRGWPCTCSSIVAFSQGARDIFQMSHGPKNVTT